VTSQTQTNEQDVVAAKATLASLKKAYMAELTAYYALQSKPGRERCDQVLKCQQSGSAYFNFAEDFVGNSDLLGAHKSALWAQGFAEDCAEILKSLPQHISFLIAASSQAGLPCSSELFRPGNTAYANMQRMVSKYLTSDECNSVKKVFDEASLPTYGFTNEAREFMSKKAQMIISISFGVSFIILLIVLSIRFPEPTKFQYQVFRTVLALAGAGAAAAFDGFIEVKFGKWLRAGGALAVFAVLYFVNPAQLAAADPFKAPSPSGISQPQSK
jgi:hypothetical protein